MNTLVDDRCGHLSVGELAAAGERQLDETLPGVPEECRAARESTNDDPRNVAPEPPEPMRLIALDDAERAAEPLEDATGLDVGTGVENGDADAANRARLGHEAFLGISERIGEPAHCRESIVISRTACPGRAS